MHFRRILNLSLHLDVLQIYVFALKISYCNYCFDSNICVQSKPAWTSERSSRLRSRCDVPAMCRWSRATILLERHDIAVVTKASTSSGGENLISSAILNATTKTSISTALHNTRNAASYPVNTSIAFLHAISYPSAMRIG